MDQITPNAFVHDRHSLSDTYRGCTYGMVRTTDGVVLVDTPMMPTDAVEWRDAITQEGDPRYLVNTHHHLDHTVGNYFFAATGIAHRETKTLFDDPTRLFTRPGRTTDEPTTEGETGGEMGVTKYIREKVRNIDPNGLPFIEEYRINGPSVYFSESATLSVGEHTFELLHTPGHTRGDVGVYVPEEHVYFAGDTVTNGEYPSLASSDPFAWVESLERVASLDVDVVVPGHGRAGDTSMVARFKRFLERCIDAVQDAINRGLSRDEVIQTVLFDDFLPPLHAGEERRRREVANVYDVVLAS